MTRLAHSHNIGMLEFDKDSRELEIFYINLPAIKDSNSAYERGFILRRFLSKIKHDRQPFYLILINNSSSLSTTRGKLLEIPGMQDITPPSIAGMLPWSDEPQIFFRQAGNFLIY